MERSTADEMEFGDVNGPLRCWGPMRRAEPAPLAAPERPILLGLYARLRSAGRGAVSLAELLDGVAGGARLEAQLVEAR